MDELKDELRAAKAVVVAAAASAEHAAAAAAEDAAATVHIVESDEEAEMWEKVSERKIRHVLPPRPARGSQIDEVP